MGKHTFEIVGYSLMKGMGIGNFIQSAIFTVGGHSWAIRFYPDGVTDGTSMFASVALVLMDEGAEVRAFYDLFLVNQIKCRSESIMCSESTATMFVARNYFVARERKLELPSNGYIQNDRMNIQCDLTVVRDSELCKTKGGFEIQVPPSDLSEHFSRLLFYKEEADVIFNVRGETFPAHKIVLATRSPVFKAQLYGKMKETKARCVTVEDMQPDVFKYLLNFIYTDVLPVFDDDVDDDDYNEMIKHLLVAADRYAMDRMKLLCASVLVENLRVETVATTLAFADQHNCKSLRDMCIEFMATSDRMRDVVDTQGYASLKRTCPSVIIDILEKTSRCHKI
jgi:speckle-type POZ protein